MDIKKSLYKFGHLKFSISQISFIDHDDLINKTIQLLNSSNYDIISSSPEKITFTGFGNKSKAVALTRSFKAISVTSYSTRLQIGIFELQKSEKGIVIKLTYFITILSEIIMLIALIIFAILTSYAVLILGIAFFFRILIKINNLKRVSKNLISGINLPQLPPLQPD
jgi:hypothetical protein